MENNLEYVVNAFKIFIFFIPIIPPLEIYDKHKNIEKAYIHFSRKVAFCGEKWTCFGTRQT